MIDWKQHIRAHLAPLALSAEREMEIIEELSEHLDDRYRERLSRGATEEEALRSVLSELSAGDSLGGELGRVEQRVRSEPVVAGKRESNMLADLWQDLRYGLRLLRKSPGLTAVAVLSLSLGIGANTAIFSLVNALLLRDLPVEKPDELVRIHTGSSHTAYPNYRDLLEQTQHFASLAAYHSAQLNLGEGESASRIFGQLVTGNYFSTLGVALARGRAFGAETDSAALANQVAVISHGLWRRRFASDPDLIGKTILLNNQPLTIVGIAPEGFRGTYAFALAPEIWVPLSLAPQILPGPDRFNDRKRQWLEIFGRLKPGVSVAEAEAEVRVVTKRLADDYREENRGLERTEIYPLSGIMAFRGLSFAPAIFIFLGLLTVIVGLVLAVACVNVANLLIARAAARQKEVAIRLALGASRGRLIRQFLSESVVLALFGGAAGCLLAFWLINLSRAFQPSLPIPVELGLALDYRVLAYTLAVSLLSGILFGLAPALHVTRPEIVPLLKEESATRGGMRSRFRLRNLLLVGQVAVSIVLLVSGGLFMRSLQRAALVDPGFETERVLTAPIDLGPVAYSEERGRLFFDELIARVERLPGVASASLATTIPLTFNRTTYSTEIDGYQTGDGERLSLDVNIVGPRYFETMGIEVLTGREFGIEDREGAPRVAIVNEAAARRFWAGANPVGRRLRFPLGEDGYSPYHEVIAMVKDSKYSTLGEEPRPFIYLPVRQNYSQQSILHVRAQGDVEQLRRAVRATALGLERSLFIEVSVMRENLGVALLPARIGAALLGLLGLLGLGLSAIGIYGVISHLVAQRTGEIGVRMALGARSYDIFRLVIGQGMKLTLAGMVIGIAGSIALTRFLSSLLVGTSPTDPLTFIAISLLLLGVAALACYFPARRATRVDPLVALRYD